MKEHNKRWLLSMMKTSGSKRRYVVNGSFSDERNTKKYQDIENLPSYESIATTRKLYNGKLNYGLLIRFLHGQIGKNWDEIYSEIISRIPTKLLEHKEIVFWFVADKIEIIEEKPYNKKSNKFIWTPSQGDYNFSFDNYKFYVDPITNKLVKVEDKPSKRKTKNLDETDLRKFREDQQKDKVFEKQASKKKHHENQEITSKILIQHNQVKKSSY